MRWPGQNALFSEYPERKKEGAVIPLQTPEYDILVISVGLSTRAMLLADISSQHKKYHQLKCMQPQANNSSPLNPEKSLNWG